MSEFIYRMQNKERIGPYMGGEAFSDILNCHSCRNGHPVPHEDIGINREMNYGKEICGFETVRQAIKWFNSAERHELRKEGFYIVKEKVKQITARGQRQVLAIPFKRIAQQKPLQFSNDAFDFSMP